MIKKQLITMFAMVFVIGHLGGCGNNTDEVDSVSDTYTDSDSDNDTDPDTDTDADNETDTDTDSDSDTVPDTDTIVDPTCADVNWGVNFTLGNTVYNFEVTGYEDADGDHSVEPYETEFTLEDMCLRGADSVFLVWTNWQNTPFFDQYNWIVDNLEAIQAENCVVLAVGYSISGVLEDISTALAYYYVAEFFEPDYVSGSGIEDIGMFMNLAYITLPIYTVIDLHTAELTFYGGPGDGPFDAMPYIEAANQGN